MVVRSDALKNNSPQIKMAIDINAIASITRKIWMADSGILFIG
jgi:hypothetical protein